MADMLALEGSLTRDRVLPTTIARCLELFGDLAVMLAACEPSPAWTPSPPTTASSS